MKKLFKKIISNKIILNFFIKLFINLHNLSYKVLSVLVVFENDGIHPKHDIMKYHNFFVDNIDKEDSVLDIGCGTGYLAYDVAKKAKNVLGIDIVETNIEKAKNNYSRDNLKFVFGDALNYNFDQKFDKIILSNVLEHIDKRIDFLKNLHSLSDKILIRVPMLTRDWLTVYKKEKGYDYKLDSTHFIEYTEDGLKKELDESGWDLNSFSIQFGELWGVIKTK